MNWDYHVTVTVSDRRGDIGERLTRALNELARAGMIDTFQVHACEPSKPPRREREVAPPRTGTAA